MGGNGWTIVLCLEKILFACVNIFPIQSFWERFLCFQCFDKENMKELSSWTKNICYILFPKRIVLWKHWDKRMGSIGNRSHANVFDNWNLSYLNQDTCSSNIIYFLFFTAKIQLLKPGLTYSLLHIWMHGYFARLPSLNIEYGSKAENESRMREKDPNVFANCFTTFQYL